MKTSRRRILTTHAGSLPRPGELRRLPAGDGPGAAIHHGFEWGSPGMAAFAFA